VLKLDLFHTRSSHNRQDRDRNNRTLAVGIPDPGSYRPSIDIAGNYESLHRNSNEYLLAVSIWTRSRIEPAEAKSKGNRQFQVLVRAKIWAY
jgi:hypothetical protein